MMYALMESLLRESHSDCPQELTCAASLISAILCILSQAYFMDAERSDRFDMVGEYHRSMRECIDYIDTHFHQPLTLDDLAVRFAVSKSAFCLLFPQFAGMPPKQYITQKRMETAALLVRSTDLPLSEVARRVGYDEFSTFYRNFKRLIGVSPSQYRLERVGEEKESGI
jgi:AraC-like DNA-binding protein